MALVLAVVAAPVYSWSIYFFLQRMTGWLYFLTMWEVLGIFAYTELVALIESLLITAGLVGLAWLLPERLRRDFVPLATILVLLSAIWAMVAQLNDQVLTNLSGGTLALLLLLYAATVAGALLLAWRWAGLRRGMATAAERLSVLLYMYLPISVASVVIILARNLG
jgi:hypothetical protein